MTPIFFHKSVQNVLASPWRWRIVSSAFPPEVAPAKSRVHQRWMAQKGNQHQNTHEEIMIALQGRGFCGLQGKIYPCHPGTVFFFNQTDYHDLNYPPYAGGMTHLWIHLMDGSAYALIQKIATGVKPQILCRVDLYEESTALRLFLRTWRDLRMSNENLRPLIPSQLKAELYLVVLEIMERSLGNPSTDEIFSKRVIRRITDHVAVNGELNVNIDDLALMAGYSKYHFARLFRRYTGQTVHHFLDGCRLSRATEMLKQGYRQKEVAAALGFKHESSFSRWHRTHPDAKKAD